MTKHRAYLVCTTGGSNKHYFVGIESSVTLRTAYGSRKPGSHLTEGTVVLYSPTAAEGEFNRIVRSKRAKGYVQITRWEDIPSNAPSWFIDADVKALRMAGPSNPYAVGVGDALVTAAREEVAKLKPKTLSETRDGDVFWRECLRSSTTGAFQWFAVIWKDGCWQFFEASGVSDKGFWRRGRANGTPFADCNDVMRYGKTCVKNKTTSGYMVVPASEVAEWADEMKPGPLRAGWKDPSVKVNLKPTKPVLRNVPTPRFVLKRKEV